MDVFPVPNNPANERPQGPFASVLRSSYQGLPKDLTVLCPVKFFTGIEMVFREGFQFANSILDFLVFLVGVC
mgnify:CR=1 FL=1